MIGLQAALRFNGGGHINHSIFWQVSCFDVSRFFLIFNNLLFVPLVFLWRSVLPLLFVQNLLLLRTFCCSDLLLFRTFCCSEPFIVQNLLLFRTFYCSEPFTFTHVVQNLCPGGSGEPTGALAAAIQKDLGSFEAMKNQLSTASVAVQVSCSFFITRAGTGSDL
jgi:hypothetical protein